MTRKRDAAQHESKNQEDKALNRRDFFRGGAAAGVGAVVLSAPGSAQAQGIVWNYEADVVILQTPEGTCKLELAKYRLPAYDGDDAPAPPPNTPGTRHILFTVDDAKATLASLQAQGGELVGELVNYEDMYWLCYVRGPAGIIVELAEKIG